MPFGVQHGCKDLAIIFCLQQQKASLYGLLSTLLQLLSVTPACALAAAVEIFSALQSATQFLLIHSICYLIISSGLSLLLANFCLYQASFLYRSCVCVCLSVLYLKPSKREELTIFDTLISRSSSHNRPSNEGHRLIYKWLGFK